MIGAMPAVAVRHERRKNKTKEKPVRPSRLQIQQMKAAEAANEALSPGGGLGSENPSHNPSRVGTPTHHLHHINGDLGIPLPAPTPANIRYGDECFFGKVSLLHFIVFFLLGGLTVLIVGAVQFKREAGLAYLRYHFLVAGALLIGIGCLLLVIKCICYRVPLPDEDEDEEELDEEKEEEEKKKLSPNFNQSPNVAETNSRLQLSPSKEIPESGSRRASRGDVHHIVNKNIEEVRSLISMSKTVDNGDKKKETAIVISSPDTNKRKDSNSGDLV